MNNFLTDARVALLAALQADAGIDALVRTWREFGPGLRERMAIEPAYCPLLALYPAGGEPFARFNAASHIAQDLALRIVTAGQDASAAEELVALVVARIDSCRDGLLGLASEGLKDVRVLSIRWTPEPSPGGARVMWDVALQVRILWIRFA